VCVPVMVLGFRKSTADENSGKHRTHPVTRSIERRSEERGRQTDLSSVAGVRRPSHAPSYSSSYLCPGASSSLSLSPLDKMVRVALARRRRLGIGEH
jgi:hypothetical protein